MADILGEKKICRMCGKCCRLISCAKSYEQLCIDAKNGDSLAINFLKLFLPYESIEDAKKVDAELVQKLLAQGIENFYYCRYINAENKCCVYEMRPKLCRQYPKNEFVPLPSDCSYEGYSFLALEKIKSKIRKAKEDLLDIKVMRETVTERAMLERFNKTEQKLIKFIDDYKDFGSYDW